MRVWFKLFLDARIVDDVTIENYDEETRTHKVFAALEEACYHFDLAKPIWLDANINEFKRRSITRFNKDNFVEEITFDYLEMQVLEEDY